MQVNQNVQHPSYVPGDESENAASSDPSRAALPRPASVQGPPPGQERRSPSSGAQAQANRDAQNRRGAQGSAAERAAPRAPAASNERRATVHNRSPRSADADMPAADHSGSRQTQTIFGTDTATPPNADYSPAQRSELANAYADRVRTQLGDIENGSEAQRNVNFLNARPFTTPSGYFSGGLLAAGHDPAQNFAVQFKHDVGMGHAQKQASSDERNYAAWQIAAGALDHDRPAPGGTLNFDFMHVAPGDRAQVADLQATGKTLQDHWQRDVATPMQDPSGALAQRSGKADAYSLRATLQSLSGDRSSEALSADGKQAIDRTLNHAGQVIVPNVYGYPMAGHAFVPYQPYDGNYEHRPNQGLMVDLNRGSVSEIHGDDDFAKWAQKNQSDALQSFNMRDRQGGKDAHWPSADDVLGKLIAGGTTTYPGYSSALTDKRVPVRELFNYTASRAQDYAPRYGNLTDGPGGIASQYQALNANNAKWADQTQVFGASQQNWKAAKEMWGSTFGMLPGVGNVGTLAFGIHDGAHGMTAQDRLGGNVAAAISGLQLAHDAAPGAAGAFTGGAAGSVAKSASHPGAAWKYDAGAREFSFQPPRADMAASPADPAGVRLNAGNVHQTLPGLTAQGRNNAQRFLAESGQAKTPLLRNQQDIDNATQFFNDGGKLGLKGGAGDGAGGSAGGGAGGGANGADGSRRGQLITPEDRRRVGDYIAQHPDASDREIGAAVGMIRSRVNRIRNRYGMQREFGQGVYVSSERRAQIADYMKQHQHETDAKVARDCNISVATLRGIRHSLKGQTPPNDWDRLTPQRRADVMDYIHRNPGLDSDAIAKETGLPPPIVSKVRYALDGQGRAGAAGSAAAGADRAARRDGAGPSTAPDPAPAPPARADANPLPAGLDLDAPLTPGQQQRLAQIRQELSGAPNPNAGGAARPAKASDDGSRVPTQPRASAADLSPQPGPSGLQSRSGDRGAAGASGAQKPKSKGGRPTHLGPERRAQLMDYVLKHNGSPIGAIADRFGVHKATVSAMRGLLGLRKTPVGVRMTADSKAEVADYIRAHPDQTSFQISDRFGVPDRTVREMRLRIRTQDQRQAATSTGAATGPQTQAQTQAQTLAQTAPPAPSVGAQPPVRSPSAADLRASPAQAQPRQPAATPHEPMVDWMLENLPQDQLQHVGASLGHIQSELAGMAESSAMNDATVQWIVDRLPLPEMVRLGQLPDAQFRTEIEAIRRRMTDDGEL